MDDKANSVAKAALVVSILSLALSFIATFNQYRENVEVIVDNINTLSFDGKELSLEAEVIVANTSQTTTSLIESTVFLNGGNIKDGEVPDIPVTLISGYAEVVTVSFIYTLSADELAKYDAGTSLREALDTKRVSIRFKSAKGKMYSGSYTVDDISFEDIDLDEGDVQ